MKRFIILLTFSLSLFLFSSCEDPVKPKAQKLIKVLKEGDFKERQEAINGLKKMGPEILPELHECAGSKDIDAAMNCKLIITEIHKKRSEALCKNILEQINKSMAFEGPVNKVKISDMNKYRVWRKKFEECTFFHVGYEESFKELNKFKNFILSSPFPDDNKKKTAKAIQEIEKELKADKNNNQLPDEWEKYYGQTDPNADPDQDGIKNKDEAKKGTNPYSKNK